MSDTTPQGEPDEVEALTGTEEVHEGASPDDERPAAEPVVEHGGIDAEREVDPGADGSDAEAGTGTADTTDDPQLDATD